MRDSWHLHTGKPHPFDQKPTTMQPSLPDPVPGSETITYDGDVPTGWRILSLRALKAI